MGLGRNLLGLHLLAVLPPQGMTDWMVLNLPKDPGRLELPTDPLEAVASNRLQPIQGSYWPPSP